MAKKESSFSGWLQRVRRTGEFSDLTVLVSGREFHLHSLPLLNASSYFRSLPSSSYGSPPPAALHLPGLIGGAQAFAVAADFCYLIKPTYTLHNVARIRAVAEFLGMAELLDSTKKFLYLHVFSHWRSSAAFLLQYQRLQSPVDEYVESRCLKVVIAACTKAFFDTKHLSAPIPVSSSASASAWHSSPSQLLTEILVRTASLADRYVSEVVDELVNGEVNLNLKCRQGRGVNSWLDNTLMAECKIEARCWVVICLSRMLEKSVTSDRPWLELSSQYWCSLLQHVGSLMKVVTDTEMLERLRWINDFLEHRIGGSLHELDDYLQAYNFEPPTLLALVKNFKGVEGVTDEEMEEVAAEVDSCLWNFVEKATCLPASEFISFIDSFPPSSRKSHDMLYAAVEKMIAKADYSADERQTLWGMVDITKLTPPHLDKALNNPAFLCLPHVLEYVLQRHSEELSNIGDEDRQNLRHIMQKVITASLKLLEENSRRSREIIELQKQYAALMGGRICLLRDSCESSPDLLKLQTSSYIDARQEEVDEVSSVTSGKRSTSSDHIEY